SRMESSIASRVLLTRRFARCNGEHQAARAWTVGAELVSASMCPVSRREPFITRPQDKTISASRTGMVVDVRSVRIKGAAIGSPAQLRYVLMLAWRRYLTMQNSVGTNRGRHDAWSQHVLPR